MLLQCFNSFIKAKYRRLNGEVTPDLCPNKIVEYSFVQSLQDIKLKEIDITDFTYCENTVLSQCVASYCTFYMADH